MNFSDNYKDANGKYFAEQHQEQERGEKRAEEQQLANTTPPERLIVTAFFRPGEHNPSQISGTFSNHTTLADLIIWARDAGKDRGTFVRQPHHLEVRSTAPTAGREKKPSSGLNPKSDTMGEDIPSWSSLKP